jgi:hypothetical protein
MAQRSTKMTSTTTLKTTSSDTLTSNSTKMKRWMRRTRISRTKMTCKTKWTTSSNTQHTLPTNNLPRNASPIKCRCITPCLPPKTQCLNNNKTYKLIIRKSRSIPQFLARLSNPTSTPTTRTDSNYQDRLVPNKLTRCQAINKILNNYSVQGRTVPSPRRPVQPTKSVKVTPTQEAMGTGSSQSPTYSKTLPTNYSQATRTRTCSPVKFRQIYKEAG